MTGTQQATFDQIAFQYDAMWSETAVGKAQRGAVWKRVDPLLRRGDVVLDLGCGTGIDALHSQASGVSFYGIDESPLMVYTARKRGVDAHCFRIEDLDQLGMRFDGALSNFGALNCLSDLDSVASSLARIVRPGGWLALCLMNRTCLWEINYFLLQAKLRKAFRRLPGRAESSLGKTVFYPSHGDVLSAFKTPFRLVECRGIGFAVPPSYVGALTEWEIEQLSSFDDRTAHKPIFRALSDHCLYLFERL